MNINANSNKNFRKSHMYNICKNPIIYVLEPDN